MTSSPDTTAKLIKRHGFVIGPRFRPGTPPNPRTGYFVYRNWIDADADFYSMHQRPFAEHKTLEGAVRLAVARIREVRRLARAARRRAHDK